jgi:hypothetical protein
MTFDKDYFMDQLKIWVGLNHSIFEDNQEESLFCCIGMLCWNDPTEASCRCFYQVIRVEVVSVYL